MANLFESEVEKAFQPDPGDDNQRPNQKTTPQRIGEHAQ
jgi:hypothetical protein